MIWPSQKRYAVMYPGIYFHLLWLEDTGFLVLNLLLHLFTFPSSSLLKGEKKPFCQKGKDLEKSWLLKNFTKSLMFCKIRLAAMCKNSCFYLKRKRYWENSVSVFSPIQAFNIHFQAYIDLSLLVHSPLIFSEPSSSDLSPSFLESFFHHLSQHHLIFLLLYTMYLVYPVMWGYILSSLVENTSWYHQITIVQ